MTSKLCEKCQKNRPYPGESRCEDCYVDDAVRYHGRDQNVNTNRRVIHYEKPKFPE